MKLSTYAKKIGCTNQSAWAAFKRGEIVGAYQLPTGTIVIPENYFDSATTKLDCTVVYARVSSSENKGNLDTQAQRVSSFCAARGWIVSDIIKECASGLNDKRPKLQKILADPKVTRIVVEHKDRLTRFGFEYIKTLFTGEIVIINEVEDEKADLLQDFVSIITSFCSKLYGQRRTARKTEAIIAELNKEDKE